MMEKFLHGRTIEEWSSNEVGALKCSHNKFSAESGLQLDMHSRWAVWREAPWNGPKYLFFGPEQLRRLCNQDWEICISIG
jgi:hypothetical protein